MGRISRIPRERSTAHLLSILEMARRVVLYSSPKISPQLLLNTQVLIHRIEAELRRRIQK
jgi:hypothetical protein